MISRKSALLIYRFFEDLFTEEVGFAEPYLHTDALWDCLYTNDFKEWFLDLLEEATDARELKPLFLELHTGRTIPKDIAVTTRDCQIEGQAVLKDLAVLALTITADIGHERETIGEIGQELKRQLELDGYIYKDKKLYQSESSVIDEPAEQTYLELLVDNVELPDKNTIKHHIKLAEEHYVNGKWGDSISNSRNFLEAVLQQIAAAFNKKKYTADLPVSTYESDLLPQNTTKIT